MSPESLPELVKIQLRVFALATTDANTARWILHLLDESREQAVIALNQTCWAEDWHPSPQIHSCQLRATLGASDTPSLP